MQEIFQPLDIVQLRPEAHSKRLRHNVPYEVHIQNNGSTFIRDFNDPFPTADLQPYEIDYTGADTDPIQQVEALYYTVPQAALFVGVRPQRIRDVIKHKKYEGAYVFGMQVMLKTEAERFKRDRDLKGMKARMNRAKREAPQLPPKNSLLTQAKALGIVTRGLTKYELQDQIDLYVNDPYATMTIDDLWTQAPPTILERELARRFTMDEMSDYIYGLYYKRPPANLSKQGLVNYLVDLQNNALNE